MSQYLALRYTDGMDRKTRRHVTHLALAAALTAAFPLAAWIASRFTTVQPARPDVVEVIAAPHEERRCVLYDNQFCMLGVPVETDLQLIAGEKLHELFRSILDEEVLLIDPHTAADVIKEDGRITEVRLLEGKHAGRVVFVPSSVVVLKP